MDCVREACLLIDLAHDRIVACNPACAAVFGDTGGALIGQPVATLLPEPARYAEIRAEAVPAAGADAPMRCCTRLRRLDGRVFAAEIAITPPQRHQSSVFAFLMLRDLEAGTGPGYRWRLQRLTPREREVFDHTLHGRSAKDIARRLTLSPRTVEVHRARLLDKLETRTTTQLLANLARAGLQAADPAGAAPV
jgi:PAS domain S-box-containing protein